MIEFLIFALVLYIGFKVAWWMVKATFFIGISAVLIGVLLMPGVFF